MVGCRSIPRIGGMEPFHRSPQGSIRIPAKFGKKSVPFCGLRSSHVGNVPANIRNTPSKKQQIHCFDGIVRPKRTHVDSTHSSRVGPGR